MLPVVPAFISLRLTVPPPPSPPQVFVDRVVPDPQRRLVRLPPSVEELTRLLILCSVLEQNVPPSVEGFKRLLIFCSVLRAECPSLRRGAYTALNILFCFKSRMALVWFLILSVVLCAPGAYEASTMYLTASSKVLGLADAVPQNLNSAPQTGGSLRTGLMVPFGGRLPSLPSF
jgi:hypothetical protein